MPSNNNNEQYTLSDDYETFFIGTLDEILEILYDMYDIDVLVVRDAEGRSWDPFGDSDFLATWKKARRLTSDEVRGKLQ